MKALVFSRHPARYVAARAAGLLRPGGGAARGPLELEDIAPPKLPGPGWELIRPRLAGICGSDISTIDARSSRYFEPIVSFPFTPGHEVVADDNLGHRVVIEPVLGCVARNIEPVCQHCAAGDLGRCVNVAFGDLEPGLQSGFCCDTGGGWSLAMAAHQSQLHRVPDEVSDESAVLVEPAACAIHAALATKATPTDKVVVIGSGTLGLLTTLALRHFTNPAAILSVARYPHQARMAASLGADRVVTSTETRRAVRRFTGSMALGRPEREGDPERLTGGADIVMDCVGSESSIREALAVVRPGGRVVLVGMPGVTNVDLTGLWHREIELVGAYAYGTEQVGSRQARTFDLALELAATTDLANLVTTTYPLHHYVDAIQHAASAGRRGAVKIAFDLRGERGRDSLATIESKDRPA